MERSTRCVLQWLAHLFDPSVIERPLLAPDARGLQMAYENGMAGLLYKALREGEVLDALPPLLYKRLKDARDRDVAMGLQSDAAAQQLGEAFSQAQIPVMALKGQALRSVLYAPEEWIRGPADIDLMVPREELSHAEEVMDRAGFVRLGKYPPEFYRNHHHLEPRTIPERPGILVDVHWTLARSPHPFQIDLEGMWKRSVPLEDDHGIFRRLDDVDQVLHLCIQLDHDDNYEGKIRSLVEAIAFARLRGVDGRTLSVRAREMDAQEALNRALSLGGRILGLPTGPGVSSRGIPRGLRGALWRWVVHRELWRSSVRRGIPGWYLNYAGEILLQSRTIVHAMGPLLRPVLANPRLGGRGFTWPKQEKL